MGLPASRKDVPQPRCSSTSLDTPLWSGSASRRVRSTARLISEQRSRGPHQNCFSAHSKVWANQLSRKPGKAPPLLLMSCSMRLQKSHISLIQPTHNLIPFVLFVLYQTSYLWVLVLGRP